MRSASLQTECDLSAFRLASIRHPMSWGVRGSRDVFRLSVLGHGAPLRYSRLRVANLNRETRRVSAHLNDINFLHRTMLDQGPTRQRQCLHRESR
jgi:hypothetical protein